MPTRMDAGARAWLVTVTCDHFWRVAAWYEFDDLLQDGHLIWWRVIQRYETEPKRVRSRGHLMALFKRSYLNHLHRLSNKKRSASSEVPVLNLVPFINDPEQYEALGAVTSVRDECSEFDRCIAEAPGPLRELLGRMVAGVGAEGWRSEHRVYADGTRQTRGQKFCRILGIPDDGGLLASSLRAYLMQR